VDGVEAPYIIAYLYVHITVSADSLISPYWNAYDNALNDDKSFTSSTFPPPPQKFGHQIPSIFCTGYPRGEPPKSRKMHENLPTSFPEIFWNRNYFSATSLIRM